MTIEEREYSVAIAYHNWKIVQDHKYNTGKAVDWTQLTFEAFRKSDKYKTIPQVDSIIPYIQTVDWSFSLELERRCERLTNELIHTDQNRRLLESVRQALLKYNTQPSLHDALVT